MAKNNLLVEAEHQLHYPIFFWKYCKDNAQTSYLGY